ncbi:hypothetical protein AGOR_G00194950 [Albula goreensis]|uniref:Ig-like domain-containing protein n=1 Tax=Albula goreensis TaxID=1534307 RepID=A0A8T3CVT9_9TELE|nr:hypothetical protein AGOR_G00194950 [Albula goreensis]
MERIFSICILCIAAVSVSSAQPKELNVRVGDTVTFPTAVGSNGGLTYSGSTTADGTSRVKAIGDVSSGQFTPLPSEQYRGRVQWDSSTGFFSITGLKMEDSGWYRVKNDANPEKLYQLTVYVPVSEPSVSYNKTSCNLYCTVDRGTEVTLSWYREGQRVIKSRIRSAPYLDLDVPVHKGGTYTCLAKNSVSNETASVTVGNECSGSDLWKTIAIILSIIIFILLIVGIVLYKRRGLEKSKKEQNKRIADLEISKKALQTQGEGDE